MTLLIAGIIAIMVLLVGITVLFIAKKKILGIIVLATAALFAAALAGLAIDGIKHGLYSPNTSIMDMVNAIGKTPQDQSDIVPNDLSELAGTDTVIELYKYTCSDCEGTYGAFQSWADDNNLKVIYVSSRSDVGIRLRDQLGIPKVPSVIAVKPDGQVIWRTIYVNGDDGSVTLDQGQLQNILDALAES